MSLYTHPIYLAKNSALPLILFWGAVFAILSLLEKSQLLPRWLLILITTPLGLLGLLHLHHAYLRISWGCATFRKHYIRQIGRMLCIFPMLSRFHSEILKVSAHLLLVTVSAYLVYAYQLYSIFPLIFFLFGVALTAFLRAALPPAVVYLASSSPERIELFGHLSAACIPGVNALLDVSTCVNPDDKVSEFFSVARLMLNDCRTTRDEDWTHVARILIEIAPIVLIDARDTSVGVKYELERILKNRIDFKVFFIAQNQDTPPLLVNLGAKSSHQSGEFFIIPVSDILKSIPKIASEAKQYWIPVRMDI